MKNFGRLWIIPFLIIGFGASAQYDIPEIPKEQIAVYDYINLLSPAEKSALDQKLIRYADSTSTQIVVAIIASAKGEDLSLLGAKWAQKWGVGQAEEDNGIFILLAKDDRSIDINTGYGIEYRLTDLMAERIINRIMIPAFKTNDYYAGLDAGSDAIFKALTGEFKEDRDFEEEGEGGFGYIPFIVIMVIVLLVIFAGKNKGGNSGSKRGGISPLDVIILSSLGRGGFGGGLSGGGFGGGGFGGGFGGGGFGGGGAGGSW